MPATVITAPGTGTPSARVTAPEMEITSWAEAGALRNTKASNAHAARRVVIRNLVLKQTGSVCRGGGYRFRAFATSTEAAPDGIYSVRLHGHSANAIDCAFCSGPLNRDFYSMARDMQASVAIHRGRPEHGKNSACQHRHRDRWARHRLVHRSRDGRKGTQRCTQAAA